LDDTGGSFTCGYWFIDISSRSVTRRFLGSGGKEVWPNPSFSWAVTLEVLGPLLVAIIVAPYGQSNIIWFVLVGILGMFVLTKIAVWYQNHLNLRASKKQSMRKKQFHFRKKNKNCNRYYYF
jgi:FSR family fosmidomycin resistance protein-like MFS transporter